MKYVNEKYRQHYKNIENQKKYNNEEKDYSAFFIAGIFIAPMLSLLLFGMAVSISGNNNRENNKDKFIEIGGNSLGCVQYSYNGDKVWKCPKDQSINQIETTVCSGGRYSTCRTEYEPVVN
ncbi:MAG: hypothetical protein RSE18_00415 [Acinetobacter sp.]